MFRNGLLVTTAMVIVGSLSFLAAQSAAIARPVTDGTSRDVNSEFLANYGPFSVYTSAYSSSGSRHSRWRHLAVPITGRGTTVRSIVVREEAERGTCSKLLSAGIYSNTASNLPGRQIAGGKSKLARHWQSVTIPITPTNLLNKTKYWVEETVPWNRCYYAENLAAWKVRPHARRHAYVQTHFFHSSGFESSSSTSPWTKKPSGPWLRVD
jgi:hypothetical protein